MLLYEAQVEAHLNELNGKLQGVCVCPHPAQIKGGGENGEKGVADAAGDGANGRVGGGHRAGLANGAREKGKGAQAEGALAQGLVWTWQGARGVGICQVPGRRMNRNR